MYKPNNILVTGAAGFIGSHFAHSLLSDDTVVRVVSYDKLTYASDYKNLERFTSDKRHVFLCRDICDEQLVAEALRENNIDTIVHFAAETHVDNSIEGPRVFFETNVMGTFSLLNQAKLYWLDELGNDHFQCRFHHVSTDEVYGALESESQPFNEDNVYAPNSPYAASKASSNHLVRSFSQTYKLPTTISNCSNNYGSAQHIEKLIPVVVSSCCKQKDIPVYGNGGNIRDWLYVADHCDAIRKVIHDGKVGETYNIGGDNELDNLSLIKLICGFMNDFRPQKSPHEKLIKFVEDRKGHDWRYAIDSSKIRTELNWRPTADFLKNLKLTVEFYLNKFDR